MNHFKKNQKLQKFVYAYCDHRFLYIINLRLSSVIKEFRPFDHRESIAVNFKKEK